MLPRLLGLYIPVVNVETNEFVKTLTTIFASNVFVIVRRAAFSCDCKLN